MKKVLGTVSTFFLLLVLSMGLFTIKAQAAEMKYVNVSENGKLMGGSKFNKTVRELAAGTKIGESGYRRSENDTLIKKIKFMSAGETLTDKNVDLISFLKGKGVTDFGSTYAVYDDGNVYVINRDKKIIFNEDCGGMCTSMMALENIDFGNKVDGSNVTRTNSFFYDCEKLKTVNWGSFSSTKVLEARCMFYRCKTLEGVDLKPISKSKIEDMGYIFSYCSTLKSADFSGFDTSNTRRFERMFQCCYKLESVNIRSFDMRAAEECAGMFSGCSSLKHLDFSGMSPKYVTDFTAMFSGLGSNYKESSLSLEGFNAKKITVADVMFANFKGKLDISSLDLSGVASCRSFITKGNYTYLTAIKTPAKMPEICRIPLGGVFYKSNDGGKTLDKSVAYTYLDRTTPTKTWLYLDPKEKLPDTEEDYDYEWIEKNDEAGSTDGANGNQSDKPLEIGKEFTVGTETYKVTSKDSAALIKSETKSKKFTVESEVTCEGHKLSVSVIGQNAFAKNKKIKAVTVPSSVSTIEKDAFKKCKKLSKITLESDSVGINKNAFKGIKKDATFVVKTTNKKAAKKLFKTIRKKGGAKEATLKIKKH
jgi:surface protein